MRSVLKKKCIQNKVKKGIHASEMGAGENPGSVEKRQLSIYREIKIESKSTLIIAVHKNNMSAHFFK